nr:WD repeat-containing protein 44-like isoform X2 [Quercus suber]
MERRKTLTMNWDGLGDNDDDDQFFESYNRLSFSSAVSINLTATCCSSSSDEEDEDDFESSRMSFSSAVSSLRSTKLRHFDSPSSTSSSSVINSPPNYDVWMSTPSSINERRKRLLQCMGLAATANITTTPNNNNSNSKTLSFNHVVSDKKVDTNDHDHVSSPKKEQPKPQQQHKQEEEEEYNVVSTALPHSPSQCPIVLVRSRSEGDIQSDSFSLSTRRKEELIGTISRQRLTRTYSVILAQHARICTYTDSISPNEARSRLGRRRSIRRSSALSSVLSSKGRLGAFFLIKSLDTGKEFVVSEYDEDGMWNRLSDLQTGKKMTMEEFEKCVGYSPVVKELMRRENVSRRNEIIDRKVSANSYFSKSLRMSKKGGAALLKNVKGLANSMSGLMGEKERELSQVSSPVVEQKPIKNSSSSEWTKVRQSGKSFKELSALHLCQEIQGHEGSIWCIKFSQDGRFLASAGEDRVIHVWEVQECEVMSLRSGEEGSMSPNISPLQLSLCASSSLDRPGIGEVTPLPSEKKRRGKSSTRKGNSAPDYVYVPETVFSFLEKPVCSFQGHLDDVLDLSWSKSQLLLSSSMDKTVRLWDLESKSCLKLFSHNDYVTCIQFNPIDDNHFISGSLDAKVRIWNIPERHVVDWIDFHEMVTAASYTPDGQGAIIGSHKGIIRMYSTEDCKIDQICQIDIQTKKKSQAKKITGFQFAPGNPSQVLVTSADSRIRILDGPDVTQKFKGFRNTSSQISASFSQDGKYIVTASEDSQVYVWKHEEPRNAGTGKSKNVVTQSHEHFQCKDVSVAIPWPGTIKGEPPTVSVQSKRQSKRLTSQLPSSGGSPTKQDNSAIKNFVNSKRHLPPLPKKSTNVSESVSTPPEEELAYVSRTDSGIGESFTSLSALFRYGDSPSISAANPSSSSWSWFDAGNNHVTHTTQPTAWGLVIVTAGLGGEIRAYQNFGLPRRIGRQTNIFGGPA